MVPNLCFFERLAERTKTPSLRNRQLVPLEFCQNPQHSFVLVTNESSQSASLPIASQSDPDCHRVFTRQQRNSARTDDVNVKGD